ncbi:hypothetical protein CDAR_238771 [Caerostris darwini]|uniref:Uncharacterized protein n=1 Tax=Caerostris darwini TaxID=1538125 RepID=A0AAV4PUL6_9ARAC|nr:hypothetical protein CDAR_238771 [Caerostris darwini]
MMYVPTFHLNPSCWFLGGRVWKRREPSTSATKTTSYLGTLPRSSGSSNRRETSENLSPVKSPDYPCTLWGEGEQPPDPVGMIRFSHHVVRLLHLLLGLEQLLRPEFDILSILVAICGKIV